MSNRRIFMIILVILSAIDIGLLWSGGPNLSASEVMPRYDTEVTRPVAPNSGTVQSQTVRIRSPRTAIDALSAAGSVELMSKRQVVLEIEGTISQVAVKVGDWVKAGDLLLALDTTILSRAVTRAEVDLQTAQAELAKLEQGGDPGEIAVAKANLAAAQENLTKVQAGATPEELAAATSKVTAAQAKYNDLFAPPSSAEIDEAKAELEKADIARQEAQRSYDKVKWRNDIGMTSESAELYKATVDFERAQAKLDRVNKPSSSASIQEAKSDLQRAQSDLELLKQKPAAADVAEALAKVQDAEQKLAKLQAGPAGADLQAAEAKVTKAQLDLEEARTKLAAAQVVAPITGAVLEVNVSAGERGTVGKEVVTLADIRQLQLTVKVAEVDVPQLTVGQAATIKIDAIRDRTFSGIVEQIDPINKSDKDVVNYPVTIRLSDPDLNGVRPGMNAVATFATQSNDPQRWLVPTTALQQVDGQTVVQVAHGEGFVPAVVTTLESQGEWTVVHAETLQEGDEVLGQVASYVGQQQDLQVTY
ncbi:MAG: efflux RND transporter periplasmic adaptor subunit [Caldilineaceae bacterium]